MLADLAHDLHRAGTAVAISGYRSPDYDRWFRGWYRWDDDGGRECLWASDPPAPSRP